MSFLKESFDIPFEKPTVAKPLEITKDKQNKSCSLHLIFSKIFFWLNFFIPNNYEAQKLNANK